MRDTTGSDSTESGGVIRSFLYALGIATPVGVALAINDLPRWAETVLIPFFMLSIPGFGVWYMTYVHGLWRAATVFIFNVSFYSAVIFAVWEIARYRRSHRSLAPCLGLTSTAILMVFVAVFNSHYQWTEEYGYVLRTYPGWPIYLIGLIAAVVATFYASKGWIYLLPYLCVAISLVIPVIAAMLYSHSIPV